MRYLYCIIFAIMTPLSMYSQASGGQIKRKKVHPIQKNEKAVVVSKTSVSQVPTILVIDEYQKTCELHSFNDLPCIPKSTSGEYVVPEKVNGYKVTQVGIGAFYFCTRINEIFLPRTITLINNSAFMRCDWLKTIILPQSLIEIRKQAFMNCYSLSKIDIPNSVKSIGSSAFSFCKKLEHICLPDGLIKIESFTFSDSGLLSVTIPSGITEIGMWAFGHCSKLETVTVKSFTPPTLEKNVFTDISVNAKLYVPSGSKANYVTAGWDKYFTRIVELNE